MNDVLISIIIPVFNEERYLGACLDSIASQIKRPHEVIVVNNNSTDNSTAVAGRYPFVRVVQEPVKGRVYARNSGFDAATGTILARIDADAILPPYWTQRIETYFSLEQNWQTTWTGGAYFYNVRFPRVVSWTYNFLIFWSNRVLIGHPTLWGSNMAVPKHVWNSVRDTVCLRNDVHEDLDLGIHAHRAGFPITVDTKTTVRVQLRRVKNDRSELWSYLQMWPRTLRIHGIQTWVLCWLFGDVLIYVLSPSFVINEWVARKFGRKPIED